MDRVQLLSVRKPDRVIQSIRRDGRCCSNASSVSLRTSLYSSSSRITQHLHAQGAPRPREPFSRESLDANDRIDSRTAGGRAMVYRHVFSAFKQSEPSDHIFEVMRLGEIGRSAQQELGIFSYLDQAASSRTSRLLEYGQPSRPSPSDDSSLSNIASILECMG